jgi:hypothetical protein
MDSTELNSSLNDLKIRLVEIRDGISMLAKRKSSLKK